MLLWSGQTVSELGSQMSLVAYPLLVLAVTGSPAKAGVVGLAKSLPIMLLALPAGALADRLNRKWLMVTCDGFRALALITLSVALATDNTPYALIVTVAFIDGCGMVISYVSERGALGQLVAPEQLSEAVARNESRFFGAMLIGPPLGGFLFGLRRWLPFVCDALSYIASTTSMLLIRSDFQESRSDSAPGQIREGFRWLWERPFFRTCSLLFAASNPIFTGLYLVVVVLAREHGASSAEIGIMLGIAAAGGLTGALLAPRLLPRISPRMALTGESWMIVISLPWMLIAHNALLLGVIVAAAELLTPVTNSIVVSYRVSLAPDRLQGRVQAASTLISFSGAWLGPLLIGLLLEHAGSTTTVLVMVGWGLMLAVFATCSRAFRRPPSRDTVPSLVRPEDEIAQQA
jgi:predicted MFS family arabinose efflux permease